jgi:hypothetical protein
MKNSVTYLIVFSLVLASASQMRAGTIRYDLAANWSNTSNPNGPWSYNGGNNPLPFQANWDPTNDAGFDGIQPAWAVAPQPPAGSSTHGDQIPLWLQSVGNSTPGFDMPAGKVIVHSWDPLNGAPDSDPANVTWTSPIDGTVVISGDTWLARKTLGRSNDFALSLNGTALTDGTVTSSDDFTSSTPESFGDFTETVHVGDVVKFQVTQAVDSPAGEFEGVDLTIVATTLTVVPEPSSFVLVNVGALLLGWRALKGRLAAVRL